MPLKPREIRKEDQHLIESDTDARRRSNEATTGVIKSVAAGRRFLTSNHVNLIQLQRPTINQAAENKSPAHSFRKLTPGRESSSPRIHSRQQVSQGKRLLDPHTLY